MRSRGKLRESWFNTRRLLEPIGYLLPAEAAAHDYRQLAEQAIPV